MTPTMISVPIADTVQMRRMTEFASDVTRLADERPDLDLRALVDDLHADLLEAEGERRWMTTRRARDRFQSGRASQATTGLSGPRAARSIPYRCDLSDPFVDGVLGPDEIGIHPKDGAELESEQLEGEGGADQRLGSGVQRSFGFERHERHLERRAGGPHRVRSPIAIGGV